MKKNNYYNLINMFKNRKKKDILINKAFSVFDKVFEEGVPIIKNFCERENDDCMFLEIRDNIEKLSETIDIIRKEQESQEESFSIVGGLSLINSFFIIFFGILICILSYK